MKGLPEHIKDVDSFYKAKSEDDFMPELPENLWDEIATQIPSSPLARSTAPPAENGGGALKGINFYHGAVFYAAGLLSAVLVYTAYLHLTHQEDTASIQVTLPTVGQTNLLDSASAVLSASNEDPTSIKPLTKDQNKQEGAPSSQPSLSETEGKLTNLKEEAREEVANPNTKESPEATPPQGTLGAEQKEKLEPTESKTTAPTTVQEEPTDFYHKHSKKAKDSLSKQLFIPRK